MNDFAQLELATMARARAALEPTAEDHARVRSVLAARIAAAACFAAAPAVPASAVPSWRRFARAHWAALGSGSALIAAVAFCAGYLVGHHASTIVVKTVTVVAPTSVPSSVSIPKVEPQPGASSLTSTLTDSGRGGTRARFFPSATPTASTADNSLSLELDLLQRAEHAIRAGEPQIALGYLKELDEKFPRGQLKQERIAARVMANCQLDDTEHARARGRAYLAAHSRSVYADRVRTLCRLESSSGAKDSMARGD